MQSPKLTFSPNSHFQVGSQWELNGEVDNGYSQHISKHPVDLSFQTTCAKSFGPIIIGTLAAVSITMHTFVFNALPIIVSSIVHNSPRHLCSKDYWDHTTIQDSSSEVAKRKSIGNVLEEHERRSHVAFSLCSH